MPEPVCRTGERVQEGALMAPPHPQFPVQVPHDLDMLLRATYFGSIVLLVSIGWGWGCSQAWGAHPLHTTEAAYGGGCPWETSLASCPRSEAGLLLPALLSPHS